MKHQIKTFLAGSFLALALFGVATAGSLEDATAAYQRGDYAVALQNWRPLAEHGNASAQRHLGWTYAQGLGVARDNEQAVAWYRKAADQGDAGAQNNLGWMYLQGQGVLQDYAQALIWLRKAVDQGYAPAQAGLGLMYAQGHGVAQDYEQAVVWYRKAVEQGFAGAQIDLGLMYEVGHGVPQDYEQAVVWYRKAADQGYAAAQYNIGRMYANGQGVPRDNKQAVIWLRKAADRGYAPAQGVLGWMYANGQGVPRDYVRTHMWLNLAVSRLDDVALQMEVRVGDDTRQGAVKALADVAAKMTPAQIVEAQRLASEWKPSSRVDDPQGSERAPSVSATLEPPVGVRGEIVALVSDGGTFKVPVTINGQLTLKFVVDSGASDVSIPVDVVWTLWRTGTITDADFLDKQTYQLADGSTFPSQRFVIRALMIGDKTLENVVGGIAPAAGSLLLGQSFLGRFKSWSIDNERRALILIDNPSEISGSSSPSRPPIPAAGEPEGVNAPAAPQADAPIPAAAERAAVAEKAAAEKAATEKAAAEKAAAEKAASDPELPPDLAPNSGSKPPPTSNHSSVRADQLGVNAPPVDAPVIPASRPKPLSAPDYAAPADPSASGLY